MAVWRAHATVNYHLVVMGDNNIVAFLRFLNSHVLMHRDTFGVLSLVIDELRAKS